MPLGQAFGVAFGLAFVVLGYVYVEWRSTARDRTASILRTLLTALSVSMAAGTGTFFLLVREPSALIGVGFAIFNYAFAFKIGFLGWRHPSQALSLSAFKTMFQVYSSGNLVAAGLCGVGCVTYGGPIGVLGAFVALYWALLHLWLLKCMSEPGSRQGESNAP